MTIISEDFNLVYLDLVLVILVIAMINIVITMKVNKQARYSTFLVYSSYIICTITATAIYITFSWYIAVPAGILLGDLAGKWIKKQLVLAKEDEEKGGYGLTKSIRDKQIEDFILYASPVDMNKIKKFKEKPVVFSRPMFIVLVNIFAFLVFAALTS